MLAFPGMALRLVVKNDLCYLWICFSSSEYDNYHFLYDAWFVQVPFLR